ncbi:hypothetical protein WNY77_21300 [Paraglaciecola mesophila]|uniref:Uncharacterized protein n=1 Tax=Paraglaciecola mesophila TaxID=197222 RepID=A0ABU9T1F4_9ALTE
MDAALEVAPWMGGNEQLDIFSAIALHSMDLVSLCGVALRDSA